MRLLDLATRTPISDAVGWTVFHSLWEGIVIAAVLAALLAAVRSPRIRYAAACLALLAMLASFIVTLIHFLPESGRGAGSLLKVTLPPWRELSDVNGNSSVFPGLAALIPWLAPVWLMGVCLFYLRYAAGWLSSHRLRSRGLCQAPVSWQRSLARLALELKISRPVSLFESLLTDVPVVVGHFRPVVLVPLGFLTGLATEYVEAILLHELGHISRSDYFMNVCQRIAEGLLFYHPAAWWISRVIRLERENCCDDMVVALRSDAHAYARALTALEQNRLQQHRPAHEAAVAATGGSLMKRITRLLYPKSPGGIWAPALAALVFIAGSAVAMAAWQANPATEQTNAKIESPWQKWLNENVVYIISDQEKAAFERLKTDEERQMFVDQFWARRDPGAPNPTGTFSSVHLTPAAEKIKQEHYRRIAYANKHFQTSSGTPGWRTDRGHMYIVYGPPDEIDSHPKTATANGIESWRYRYVEGLGDNRFFTFIDRTGSGDYRLAPGTGQ